jgi:hypothetical protein
VKGVFNPRGGIAITAEASYPLIRETSSAFYLKTAYAEQNMHGGRYAAENAKKRYYGAP